MLKNYFTVALRNLLKHKVFSLINITGLSLGIACCTLLALYIQDEFNYEKHFADADRVYRLYTIFSKDGRDESFPLTSPPIALDMQAELPEIETATRVVQIPDVEQHLIRYNNNVFFESEVFLVDSTFFDVFPYEFKEGDRNTAFNAPASVVISEEFARKIFADKSPLSELIVINSGESTDTFQITGVLKKLTSRSHVDANLYMGMNTRGLGKAISRMDTWAWQNFVGSYLKLKPGTLAKSVDDKIPAMMEKRAGELLRSAGLGKVIHLQPLLDIRLYSNFNGSFGVTENGNIQYVYILSSIGIFILLIACINFMNLTTAKASQRAGEVGVRKSLGATRANLIRQFLGESMTIVSIALLLAMVVVQLILPAFNFLTQKELSIGAGNIGYIAASLLLITAFTGLVAGSYPAFFLSSFQPAQVLKDKRLSGGNNWLRKSLVVFQFIISITLISSIVIIYKQLNFIQSKPLGFDQENKIMLPFRTEEAKNNYPRLKNSFQQIADVKGVSGTISLPSTPLLRDFALYAEGSTMEKAVFHRNILVDENYFKTLNIKLLAGRDFRFETDSMSWKNTNRKVILNQQGLKELGIELDKAVGSMAFFDFEGVHYKHEIIGVIEDFHQFSLHETMVPIVFNIPAQASEYNYLIIACEGNPKNMIAQLEVKWKELIPNTPFEASFLSDSVAKQYENDSRTSNLIMIATVLAIVISCLGLYGLSIYVAERRVKEIGIRKVMGASVKGIVVLLSKEFVKLVIISFVIAIPIGYYAMNKWLLAFAYKIELNAMVFVLTGIISLTIAWVTISFESIKAAISNPVNSLRNE